MLVLKESLLNHAIKDSQFCVRRSKGWIDIKLLCSFTCLVLVDKLFFSFSGSGRGVCLGMDKLCIVGAH